LGAYTLFIAGDVSVSGGSLSCPGGNVVFDGDLTYTDSTGNFAIPDLYIGTSPDTTTLGSNMLVGNLTINAGDRFIAAGYDLTVLGNLVCYGNLDASIGTSVISVAGDWVMGNLFVAGGSNIVLNGTAAQSFTAGGAAGNALNTLTVANSDAQVSFEDGFSAGNLHCFTPGANLSFAAGGTYTVTVNVSLEGSTAAVIYVNSSTGASRFELDNQTGSVQTVRYLHMGNSEVSTDDIYAFFSNDDGGTDSEEPSPHWVFDNSAYTWTWTGDGADAAWETQENWDVGDGSPGDDGYPDDARDRVYINATGNAITTASAITVGELNLQDGFSGNLTLGGNLATSDYLGKSGNLLLGEGNLITARDSASDISVGGELSVELGGNLFVRRSSTSGNGNGQTITAGALTIDAGGSISADGQGFAQGAGPGKGTGNWDGGGYGGVGGDDDRGGITALVYGNIITPTALGSGGASHINSGAGGGAIVLQVSGATALNGNLSAIGSRCTLAGGSGGSIYLRTGTLSGSGNICADGGVAFSSYGAGGGGRIAVILTGAGADFTAFTGPMHAYGGISNAVGEDGAAGTVYQETQAQAGGAGYLIIDNGDRNAWGGVNTLMPDSVTVHDFGMVIIRNKGNLAVGADDFLDFTSLNLSAEDRSNATITIKDMTGVSLPSSFT
ncbi:MAG: hypothetical protein HQL31_14420, partial [Planctomycetes bacterium]|nr:hypothetical protein [Planctomycetota bacterium]